MHARTNRAGPCSLVLRQALGALCVVPQECHGKEHLPGPRGQEAQPLQVVGLHMGRAQAQSVVTKSLQWRGSAAAPGSWPAHERDSGGDDVWVGVDGCVQRKETEKHSLLNRQAASAQGIQQHACRRAVCACWARATFRGIRRGCGALSSPPPSCCCWLGTPGEHAAWHLRLLHHPRALTACGTGSSDRLKLRQAGAQAGRGGAGCG